MKRCSRCGMVKSAAEFRSNRCRDCRRQWDVEYKARLSPEIKRERRQRWRLRYPEKKRAQRQVADAIESGKLVRPSACESCGVQTKPQGHHPDYSKPLDVRWLCKPCHAIADRQRLSAVAVFVP